MKISITKVGIFRNHLCPAWPINDTIRLSLRFIAVEKNAIKENEEYSEIVIQFQPRNAASAACCISEEINNEENAPFPIF